MFKFLEALLSNIVVIGLLMGRVPLLFILLKYDYAILIFCGAFVGLVAFIYWPRRRQD